MWRPSTTIVALPRLRQAPPSQPITIAARVSKIVEFLCMNSFVVAIDFLQPWWGTKLFRILFFAAHHSNQEGIGLKGFKGHPPKQ